MITTQEILREAKKVKTKLASLSTEEKNNALLKMADALIENADEIFEELRLCADIISKTDTKMQNINKRISNS